MKFFSEQIVEHDDVGTGGDSLVCFLERLTFHIDKEGESSNPLNRLNGRGDRS